MATRIKSGGKYQGDYLRAIRKHWFGGVCMWNGCQETKHLQLAHTKPTPLTIEKPDGFRSSYERLKDVMKYPERHILLCNTHHKQFDKVEVQPWSAIIFRKKILS